MTNIAKARYMLRRNLPLWKPAEAIQETIGFCKHTGVDEVIWKIDAEEFNHGFTPISLLKEFLPWLQRAKALQSREGISFSINPWATLNHIGRHRYPEGPPNGFRWCVKPGGEIASEMACPLSPAWLEWLLGAYRLYASTRPDILWIEDDFKTYAHNPRELGCFCDVHLADFGSRIGEAMSRKELVERLTGPGQADTIRARWLDFQGEIMVEICRKLEEVVHAESPDTRLGLMNSWSTDGRWWSDAIVALAGTHRPLARTSLAPYSDVRPLDYLPDAFDALKETACLPEGTQNCPELENSTYTSFSKSVRATRLQMIMSQVLGNPSITMNLFDMLGSPMTDDVELALMLRNTKPFLSGVAAISGGEGTTRGISIPFPKRYADFARGKTVGDFGVFRFDGDGWSLPLQGSGLPIIMNGDSQVSALTGQSARSLSDGTLGRLLSRGLLLDGRAASVLCEMGYSAEIGVQTATPVDRSEMLLSAERDDQAIDKRPAYMSLQNINGYGSGDIYPLMPLPGTEIASTLVDTEHQAVMPGFVRFENGLGGRVMTYPFDLSVGIGASFMNWHRRRQLQRFARWLYGDAPDLLVEGGCWMMPVRRDYPGHIFVAVLNFNLDPWHELTITIRKPEYSEGLSVRQVREDGTLEPADCKMSRDSSGSFRIFMPIEVGALDGVAFEITPVNRDSFTVVP